ncbi:MAG: hypothetical protein A2499_02850 [Stygiobacter sp. RIFOXYC12_FULL_38_8]|nr:MAG: hypothetical protein A2299_02060 [Stygiobacter sp. RIFOXYB2_FULL_37_11]OGV15129.1 MAG: hypothetical protein A2440_07220 [Stygiobacter sp. RIFOXYC2_FULL_38_25]OGV17064.1 MAG: hypothetical protein A2237_18365 [Stygiobacter sp. RIFOXYA2_FULL_38_8]OGV27314.1 MAG: hypothetical protein A2499_02850 [Stygiobacter sp. RIFOXYC12_FULL_38_8]OGV79704.1 MAG: hypothetical protein A2X65_19305 [Stygiobacter sp. GWF2_38_21]
MAEQKTYSINGREFKLKESLTLQEQEIIQKPLRNFRTFGLLVAGNFTANEASVFFSTILSPADGNETPKEFFLSLDEKLGVKILSDFFLSRIENYSELLNLWEKLEESSQKLKKNFLS